MSFPGFRDAGCEDCLSPEQDHLEFLLYFKKKVSVEEQIWQDRFLRGRQIAFMIYEPFRVTGAHDIVLDYADLFSISLRNDDVQELDTRWDGNLLSRSKISKKEFDVF